MISTYTDKVAKIISLPYPYLFSLKRNILLACIFGLFIYFINSLVIDEAVVFSHFTLSKNNVCLLAGFSTFLSILFVVELIPQLFFKPELKETWTTGKEFLLIVSLIFTIAFFNTSLSYIVSKSGVSFNLIDSFLNALLFTIALGAVPTILVLWLNYTILLKRNLKAVSLYNQQLESKIEKQVKEDKALVEIQTNNKSEIIQLDLHSFLFAKSEGNYTDIFIDLGNGVTTKTFRLTIKQLEEALTAYPWIIRTHRSYVINTNNINETFGNARNFRIHFKGIDLEVPVSRNRFEAFKKAFNS